MLQPLQPYLAGTLSRANQPPVHDAVDSVSLRSWLNNPCTASLEADIYKAANIVQTFTRAGRLEPERSLPQAVLQGAQGLALLSVIKIGAGWSAALGTGLVVSRQANGSWSAPCAVGCFGVGWGLQLGGELTDLLLVLRTKEAVAAFCGRVQMGVGGNIAAAVGPVGRHAGASMQLGDAGAAAVYSYSCSKGAYVGVAIEGTAMMVREAVNMNFYGYPVTARQLLLEGAVPQPPAATMLYDGLHTLMHKFEQRRALGGRGVVPDRTAAAAATSTAVAAATAAAAAQAASSSTQSTAATVQAAASAVVAPARSAVTAARVQVQNWSTLMRRRPSQPQPPAQQERGEPMLA